MNQPIKIKSDTSALESTRILYYLRFYEDHWTKNGGFETRKNMKYWQDKADQFIKDSVVLPVEENNDDPKNENGLASWYEDMR